MSCDLSPEEIRASIVAKSDQLNADDLVGGPITVRITGVRRGPADQPVHVFISDRKVPWKPCKTARRVLAAGWGEDASAWVGRWIRLYRDDSVLWAGVAVGGIRVSGMSHIPRPLALQLQYAKGKKSAVQVEVITPPAPTFYDQLMELVTSGVATKPQVHAALSQRKPQDVPPSEHAAILAQLRGAHEPQSPIDGGEE